MSNNYEKKPTKKPLTPRLKKPTEVGHRYQLEMKFKALNDWRRSLKSISEELKSFMAEKCSVL